MTLRDWTLGPAIGDARTDGDGERPSTVLMIDDHDLLLRGLRAAFEDHRLDFVAPSGLSHPAILASAAETRPALVLLDLRLGEGCPNGLDLIAPLTALGLTVVLLTGVTDHLVLAAGLESGAAGVIGKHHHLEDIVRLVDAALAGFSVTPVAEREAMLDELRRHRASVHDQLLPFQRLSPRERVVLQYMLDGMSAEEMAEDHVVSLATVRTQIHSVLQKLGVHSQLAAVSMAARAGWTLDQTDAAAVRQSWR